MYQEQSEHSFKEAAKLEAVNLLSPENIHVATVTRVKGQYIWLSLEGNVGHTENSLSLKTCPFYSSLPRPHEAVQPLEDPVFRVFVLVCVCACAGLKQPMPELIVHVDSLDIFPVSWCETNGYPLVYPIKPAGNALGLLSCSQVLLQHCRLMPCSAWCLQGFRSGHELQIMI